MKYLLLLILGFLLVLIGCQAQPSRVTVSARVERVLSGQVIEVTLLNQNSSGRKQVRLQGIDAPDRQQTPWGQASLEKLTALIEQNNPQKVVQLELQEIPEPQGDRFNRLVAPVWQNQVLLNLVLVQGGYALAQLPKETQELEDIVLNKYQVELLQAQAQARVMGVGIWDTSQPLRLTPAEFRRHQQPPQTKTLQK